MESLDEIYAALEKPLALAAQDDHRYLSRIKNLDRTIPPLASRAAAAVSSPDARRAFNELASAFADYPALRIDAKRAAVRKGLDLIARARSTHPEGEPCPDGGRERKSGEETEPFRVPIMRFRGVGEKTAARLGKLGITDTWQALWSIPREYQIQLPPRPVSELSPGTIGTVDVRVASVGRPFRFRSGVRVYEVLFEDDSGAVPAVWYNFAPPFTPGQRVRLIGKVEISRGRRRLRVPEVIYNPRADTGVTDSERPLIVPVYPLTEGLGQRAMRALLRQVVAAEAHRAPDHLPPGLAQSLDLPSLSESFRHVHRPPPEADLDALNAGRSAWHKRLAFEEVFFFELQIALQRRRMTRQPAVACPEGGTIQRSLRRSLPFTLTGAQIRVLHEIGRDLATPHPMHRLLQGDVGSGKTVVALLACLQSIDAGCQSAVMAPTEILAVQHHHTMKALLGKSGVRAALLTSGTSKVERGRLLRGVSSGTISLLIGTHALLEDDVQFRKLGMVVVDEQHRFGVEQRLRLQAKGRGPEQPHVLVMTATPIPRSLALTVYGDLDLSVIDELPPGRVPAETRHFVEKDRAKIYNAIREEGSAGRQVFVVYPLVSESEKLDLLDATRMAERLSAEFSEFNVGLVHGQMKSAEKDASMNQFKQGKIQVLVATTVIEVGIDIPNATLMVVEHAERFGLSQLHQLRGRIGRGVGRGRCFLLTPTLSRESEAARRMRIMVETHDGFKVAEHDLALRGPGALLGARQHGLPDFWTANLLSHRRLISDAREAARSIVSSDPEFSRPEHQGLEAGLRLHAGERLHGLRSG